MKENKTFHEKLKYYRESVNLSQSELATRLEVSRQTFARWESGRSFPDLESIVKLSTVFDVSIDELLKEEVEIIRKNPAFSISVAEEEDKSYLFLLVAIISLLTPFGFLIALYILLNNRKTNCKYKLINIICVVSFVFNIVKIIFNAHLIIELLS